VRIVTDFSVSSVILPVSVFPSLVWTSSAREVAPAKNAVRLARAIEMVVERRPVHVVVAAAGEAQILDDGAHRRAVRPARILGRVAVAGVRLIHLCSRVASRQNEHCKEGE